MREAAKNLEAMGVPTLIHMAEWMYLTERDSRVCPFCRRYQGTIHRGDYIPRRFPFYRFLDDRHIAPEVHHLHPFLQGVCRCVLELMNADEVCGMMLHDALEAAL